MFWDKHKREVPPLECRFNPKPDITVYELAVILSKTMHQPVKFPGNSWATVPPEIQRRFQ